MGVGGLILPCGLPPQRGKPCAGLRRRGPSAWEAAAGGPQMADGRIGCAAREELQGNSERAVGAGMGTWTLAGGRASSRGSPAIHSQPGPELKGQSRRLITARGFESWRAPPHPDGIKHRRSGGSGWTREACRSALTRPGVGEGQPGVQGDVVARLRTYRASMLLVNHAIHRCWRCPRSSVHDPGVVTHERENPSPAARSRSWTSRDARRRSR